MITPAQRDVDLLDLIKQRESQGEPVYICARAADDEVTARAVEKVIAAVNAEIGSVQIVFLDPIAKAPLDSA